MSVSREKLPKGSYRRLFLPSVCPHIFKSICEVYMEKSKALLQTVLKIIIPCSIKLRSKERVNELDHSLKD